MPYGWAVRSRAALSVGTGDADSLRLERRVFGSNGGLKAERRQYEQRITGWGGMRSLVTITAAIRVPFTHCPQIRRAKGETEGCRHYIKKPGWRAASRGRPAMRRRAGAGAGIPPKNADCGRQPFCITTVPGAGHVASVLQDYFRRACSVEPAIGKVSIEVEAVRK